jgi:hypothetical protein
MKAAYAKWHRGRTRCLHLVSLSPLQFCWVPAGVETPASLCEGVRHGPLWPGKTGELKFVVSQV